ncbi:NUDIX hydrolase [Hyaloraphidium curvatum]|nr:NUDIX hydrolase [Hyaloraphidium curvatum]
MPLPAGVAPPDSAAGLRIREAARGLIVDPAGRVLLVRFEFPAGTRWATPGGGIEPGESPLDAVRRELREEVGLADPAIGPHLWTRLHVTPFTDGKWDGQRERVFLVRTDAFEPQPEMTWDELRAEYVHELRWWTLEEIETSADTFIPRALGILLRTVLEQGPPEEPWEIGV